jgi:hypothetical protein
MISDVLSEATRRIRDYQAAYPSWYADLRTEIDTVVASMDALREKLDTPPSGEVTAHDGAS